MKGRTFFIYGAEGVGKSSILEKLETEFPKIDFHDFDEFIVPPNPTLKWRLDTTLIWIKKAIENQEKGIVTCIVGLCFPEELMSFVEFNKLEGVSFCLLDVSKEEREKRLIKRNASKDVIGDLECFLEIRKQNKKINGNLIDTTNLTIEDTIKKVSKFVRGELNGNI